MKVNTNSNVYIIIYSVVMVVIVAVLLALAAESLKPLQSENILNEKKTQIVKALGETASYEEVVAEAALIDADGKLVDTVTKNVFAALQNVKGSRANGLFPIFKAKNGCVVVPLSGDGLWGPIWGYVALEKDMNTIKGIVLDHKGETPGLGAEIANDNHQKQYKGKTIFKGKKFMGITLVKDGVKSDSKNIAHEVDAISGGTMTSDGVTNMIKNSLESYKSYFEANKAEVEAVVNEPVTTEAEGAEDEKSNDKNTENNGK